MISVEIHLEAIYTCDVCGESYRRPAICRIGDEARDFFSQLLSKQDDPSLWELRRAIEEQLASGNLVPAELDNIPAADWSKMRAYSFERSPCSQGHDNGLTGIGFGFICDQCGRSVALDVPVTSRPKEVTCSHCGTHFLADWILIGKL